MNRLTNYLTSPKGFNLVLTLTALAGALTALKVMYIYHPYWFY